MEYHILTETLKRLPPDVTTEEIHQTIINVCLDKEEIEYSRVASKLEMASILKNQERLLGIYKPEHISFSELLGVMEERGLWAGAWLQDDDLITCEDEINEVLIELEAVELEYPTVKQIMDKYANKVNNEPVETPAQAALAISIALHGVTTLAFNVARDLIHCRLNIPTPLWNGVRDGNNNSISCCVIEGGDTVGSITTAIHVASEQTSRKAGIGITLDTRSKGDSVKNGQVAHLGKAPLYRSIESSVKLFTQISRGGSATITFKCIDPDVFEMLNWKTQRVDLAQRIDKVDYSLSYNDEFLRACINNDDWYLFGLADAPKLHENFHAENYLDYVKCELRNGTKHKKVKAIELLEAFLASRVETGRVYCFNVTSANLHTPFLATIKQSNLCQEISLPTRPFIDMADLYSEHSDGEIAFCSLAALNVACIDIHDYPAVAERGLRTVDRMISLAAEYAMTDSIREKLLERKSVGIGITGLAGFLYQQGLDYDGSARSLEAVEELCELHYYTLLRASQKIAAESEEFVEGIDTDWLPIDTMVSHKLPTMDWESLRGVNRAHSVLVAHMPCESSSLASASENGLYPSRQRVIYKKARRGNVQFISKHFDPSIHRKAWDVDMTQ
jgi:ribonucleoside-diphosphate reductase alpha chain